MTDNNSSRTPGISNMINDPVGAQNDPVGGLRTLINKYCGAHASQVQIMVTETNSVYGNPGRQTTSLVNALFLDDDVMTWLDNGAANVDWWAVHNGPVDGSTTNQATGLPLYGTTNYGDFGFLSSGGAVEPSADTRFPAYYGMQMLTHAMTPGGYVVSTSSSQSAVTIHANGQANSCPSSIGGDFIFCSFDVLFINKDPNNTYDETVSLGGEVTTGTATVYTYGENSTAISPPSTFTVNNSKTFNVTLPPYSLVAVDLPFTTYFCFC